MKGTTLSVEEISLCRLSEDIASRQRSPVDVATHYLKRIVALDQTGPRLRSVIETNPHALQIATAMEAELRGGRWRGPLHGIPILIKDNIDTCDAMATTAGSLALVDVKRTSDATLVKRLRASGAVLLGKTNMSEWANARGAQSTSGWSARGGLTRNPHVLDRTASGSSTGSAVAVAASLCAAAVGTETDGSILCPAAACGVVGLKPTVGLISRVGVIPLATSQDSPGPIARSVRDCAMLLDVLAGPDLLDSATLRTDTRALGGYANSLDPSALNGARLGVMTPFMPVQDGARQVYESALTVLQRAGATLVRIDSLPDLPLIRAHERVVMLSELNAGLNGYLGNLSQGAPRSVGELIEYNIVHARTEMAWFRQERLEQAQRMPNCDSQEYRHARSECLRLARRMGIEAMVGEHALDALVAPTMQPPWGIDLVLGDPPCVHSCTLAAVAGTPGITVPAGQWHGLPLGLSFYGMAWQEQMLLDLALGFEQLAAARVVPTYRRTIQDTATQGEMT